MINTKGLVYNTCMGKVWNHSAEARAKMSDAAKKRYAGYARTVKCDQCSNDFNTTIARIGDGRGRYCSRKCKGLGTRGKRVAPQTEFKPGFTPWNKGKALKTKCAVCSTEFTVQRKKKHIHCSRSCSVASKVRSYTCKNCEKIFEVAGRGTFPESKFCSNRCQGLFYRGANHFAWKGGTSTQRRVEMGRKEYQDWRKAVLKRDNYICQICGVRGVSLQVDHIKQWAHYPELRYELSNGRVLCVPCHMDTPTWGNRKKKS